MSRNIIIVVVVVILIIVAYIFGKDGCNSASSVSNKSGSPADSALLAAYQLALDAQNEYNKQLVIELNATREALGKVKPTVIVKTFSTGPANTNGSTNTKKDPNLNVDVYVNKEEKKEDLPIGDKNLTDDTFNVPQGYMDVILPSGCVQYWGDGTEWTHQNTNGQTTVRVPVKYGVNLFNGKMADGTYLDKQSVTFLSGSTKITGSTVTNNWRGESVKNFQIVYDGKTINFK